MGTPSCEEGSPYPQRARQTRIFVFRPAKTKRDSRIGVSERLRLIGAGGRCKTVVDAEIAAFRPSAPFQSVPKTRKPSLILWIVLREASQHADASSLIGLLRFRRERPRRRCAANKRDELATPHGLATQADRRTLPHPW